MESKNYIPIYPNNYKFFKDRKLIKSFFELDCIDSHNRIIYIDFCIEFKHKENQEDSEDAYYTPYKFELDYRLFKLNDEEFKRLAVKKMFEIKENIENYISHGQELIYKNRIIVIKGDEH